MNVEATDNIFVEHNYESNTNEVSVQPTINIPIVQDVNNNNIVKEYQQNPNTTEMVTIEVYKLGTAGEDGKDMGLDFCLLPNSEDRADLDDIFGIDETFMNSQDSDPILATETGQEGLATETEKEDFSIAHNQEYSTDTGSYDLEDATHKRSRKRKRNIEEWQRNIRKRRRQSGKEYTTSNGKLVRAREIKSKKDCTGKCKFKCATVITSEERQKIFDKFWNLSDTEKTAFYVRTTEYSKKQRTRTNAKQIRKKFSYKYFLYIGTQKIRVCKEFYLQTLDISQRRIEYLYKSKVQKQESLKDKRGSYVKGKLLILPQNISRDT